MSDHKKALLAAAGLPIFGCAVGVLIWWLLVAISSMVHGQNVGGAMTNQKYFKNLVLPITNAISINDGNYRVLELPIAKHTDSLREGFLNNMIARPTNEAMIEISDKGVVEFSVTILSRMETNNNRGTIHHVQEGTYEDLRWDTYSSNVIARIVWKGHTNECVLERNP